MLSSLVWALGGAHTKPSESVPDSGCPGAKLCPELERYRRECEAGNAHGCDSFVGVLEKLLPSDGCSGPAIWKCEDEGEGRVSGGMGLALRTLLGLKTEKARALFGSAKLRSVLSGEYAESYWKESVHTERLLVVRDDDAKGRGPVMDVCFNYPSIRATASSTLHPQGRNRYDPSMAFDGLPFTGWCEGVSGDGTGEWIEFDLPVGKRARSRPFRAFQVIPGYAKTQATYTSNGRVTKVRISSCSHPEAAFIAELKPSIPDDFNSAVVTISVPKGALAGERCARVTILAVHQGSVPDACISEITPIF